VRFQRMRGHAVHFVCAEDAHGAAIMIAAENAGKTPQQFIAEMRAARQQYLDGFHIASITGYDRFRRKTSPCRSRSTARCRERGLVSTRTIEQFL